MTLAAITVTTDALLLVVVAFVVLAIVHVGSRNGRVDQRFVVSAVVAGAFLWVVFALFNGRP